METIINLTQHPATDEQVAVGVVDVANHDRLLQLLDIKVSGPDGFATLHSPADFLRTIAERIMQEFVLDASAELARKQIESLTLEPGQDNIALLNFREYLGCVTCMVGGFPPLVDELVRQLKHHRHTPVYAMSDRVAVERETADGIVKTSVFRHIGFYPA